MKDLAPVALPFLFSDQDWKNSDRVASYEIEATTGELMRTYRIEGAFPGCSRKIREKLRQHFGDAVEVDEAEGRVRVGESADPQIVSFLLDEAGFPVGAVEG